jgi:formylglycine-generating enzyme required for sulfatase activity/energy-coupling factor transporter ATP-binding protein EcfA2
MARYALVVGIDEYQHLRQLNTPHRNAEAVAQKLEQREYFWNVTRLPAKWHSSTHAEVAAGGLKCDDLITELQHFLSEKAKDSEALIYFSGHGVVNTTKVSRIQEGYLATSDHENGIPLREFNDLVSRSKVSSLVVLLDCCHAGSLLNSDLVKQTLTAFNERDFYLIAACRPSEDAYEGPEYSIFTEALLKGLSPECAEADGKISCDRVFSVIDAELRGKGQEPIRLGYGRSLVLVSYPGQTPQKKQAVEPLRDEDGEILCPYQGLLAFTKAERPFFFGRQRVVEELERKLLNQPFISLIGASGSGKSSVVLAGLMPHLEDQGWQILEPIKPGLKPLNKLEEVLRKHCFADREDLLDQAINDQTSAGLPLLLEKFPPGRHLLVVDQFEELFTVSQAEQRDRFIHLITQVLDFPDSPLAVVTTMRADFLQPCLNYELLSKAIEKDAKLLSPLKDQDLIDAIREPARRQGYEVTDELLYQILKDIKDEPGFLPLLEFALTQLWSKRDEAKHQLTLDSYEAIGGIVGALNNHADQVYQFKDFESATPKEERSPLEQGLIKRIFLELLQIGDGEVDTRLRQSKQKILAIAKDNPAETEILNQLIDGKHGLVKGRLLVTGNNEQQDHAWVDLAHEALISGWSKLNEWRTENRDGRRLAKQAEKDGKTWSDRGKSPDFLWRGSKLEEADQILREYESLIPLSDVAREFIEACQDQELSAYLQRPEVDNLNQKTLEQEAASKSFLTKPRMRLFLADESRAAGDRLRATWLLRQWGEVVPVWQAETDRNEAITLTVIESPPQPKVVEDLGNGVSLEMMEIPGGKFLMGSPDGEGYSDEKPQHEVKVESFLIGKYPVTQAQWRAVANLPRVKENLEPDPSNTKGADYPVEVVNWYEAIEFCQRLSRQTGKTYRLPSEAEWEYACRAGTTSPYHFGSSITTDLANYVNLARGRTTPVERFQVANGSGLYDMHGNVYEWCEDDWHDNYRGAPTDGSAWIDDNDNRSQLQKSLRGGSWSFDPVYCRSAYRYYVDPTTRGTNVGFRVVCLCRGLF